MLSYLLSPVFPTLELSLEDQLSNKNVRTSNDQIMNFNCKEWSTINSFGCSSPYRHTLQNSMHSGATTSGDPSKPSTTKKLNHNASERDRRKKLNNLYSTLRSLLPKSETLKKLSNPSTLSQVLKYIPELQSQVERLVQKKEEILLCLSKLNDFSKRKEDSISQFSPTVFTRRINDRQVLIQICTYKVNKSPFYEVLHNLEGEDLQVLNASVFAACENRVIYTLHLQVKDTQNVEFEVLKEKILSLF
ncbi:hypothetical protein IFM89_005234 [Coptis chinensis]|uniref:BHLH domain-containing protein n=1 Tax=Coptis chinensis TaxID=261450 RepID=A0A835LDM9_9MAGN|nr:hypothetical protein IFM89_005234 [Coptis chinensis]